MQQRLTTIGAVLAFWTFLALLFTPQTYIINLRAPTPLSVWQAFAANALLFYVWALLTPAVLRIGRRFPLERPHFARHLLILLTLAFPFALLQIVLVWAANNIFLSWAENYQSPIPIPALLIGYGATNVMVYSGIIAASQAFNYFRRYREREKSLARAQLQALQTQLNPHFLFNTLNAIAELVYDDAREAERTIGKLSELLRMTLRTEPAQEIALHEELKFLRKYLEIQQTLLQDRLKIEWRIAPETYEATVPNMILQPLVENSIRHGIAPRRGGGTIRIEAARCREKLVLIVEDDGLGMRSGTAPGIGLQNTTTRLRHLYGAAHEFRIESRPAHDGTAVEISLPFRESEEKGESEEKYDGQDTHSDS